MSLLVAFSKHPIIPDLVPPVPWPAETPGSLKTSDSSLSPEAAGARAGGESNPLQCQLEGRRRQDWRPVFACQEFFIRAVISSSWSPLWVAGGWPRGRGVGRSLNMREGSPGDSRGLRLNGCAGPAQSTVHLSLNSQRPCPLPTYE